ncbi:MAG: hypothetical protein ACRBF0_10640 [Calditrichia bacterium]
MGIARQILLQPNTKTILFFGDKTRLRLIRRLALDLEKNSSKVVLLSCADSLLPPSGQLVVGSTSHVISDQIQRAFVKNNLVYAASSLFGSHAKGFAPADIHNLVELLPDSYFLVDAGDAIFETPLFEQYCICLDADRFRSDFASENIPSLVKTLSVVPAKKALLFVDAVRTLERENRLLSLSREWLANGVEHVVLADLNRDFLRSVEHA